MRDILPYAGAGIVAPVSVGNFSCACAADVAPMCEILPYAGVGDMAPGCTGFNFMRLLQTWHKLARESFVASMT